jgi:FlaA1/EpsC-like NDP-sugar epimerase
MAEQTTDTDRNRPFWERHLRREVQHALDIAVLLAAFSVAYLLRFDFAIPEGQFQRALVQAPVVLLIQFCVVVMTGIHRFVWRYVGMAEIWVFARGALLAGIPILALRLFLPERFESWRVPLSIIVLDAVLAFGGLLAIRVLRRSMYERYEREFRHRGTDGKREPVILVGAGRAGVAVMREISGRGDTGLDVVGFVDDDRAKHDTLIHGKRVLGSLADLESLATENRVRRVIITIAAAKAATIRTIVKACEKAGLRALIIPGLYEILQGKVSISRFRDVDIEDLLGREPVELDTDRMDGFLTGRTVMITGAGGSIGAELCRQAARFGPRALLLFERAEGALFEIHREIEAEGLGFPVVPIVGDVSDHARVSDILGRFRPDVVLHAAAHKHVPMMESNPGEAIKNNVAGTRCIAQLAGEMGIEAFVMISTDKAVRPSSIMGASKRIAELICQDLADQFDTTRFVAVRFGNVMGSTGSVVPIFRQQIGLGGPVTVTHRDAVRYFMTIPEAAQLVLEAGAIGASGDVMILDMGRPIRIAELAEDMISLSGYKPYEDIAIEFVGLRPGEKLAEELELTGEDIVPTQHPKILIGRVQRPSPEFRGLLADLTKAGALPDEAAIRGLLRRLIPESNLLTGAGSGTGEGGGLPASESPN